MIDWLELFEKRFQQYPEIKHLSGNRFHGAIEINFCDGEPMNYNLKMHRKANIITNQPITKGESQ